MNLLELLLAQLGDYQTGNATDERVLDATLELVEGQGLRITADDIAAKSEVSRATIFRRFNSKERIFESLIQREISKLLVECLHESARLYDPKERAISVISLLFERCLNHALSARFIEGQSTQVLAAGSSLLDITRMLIADLLRAAYLDNDSNSSKISFEVRADAMIHMLVGYSVLPDAMLDTSNPEEIRILISDLVNHLSAG